MTGEKETDPLREEGVEIPYEELNPETLIRVIEEFVTRGGENWEGNDCSLGEKVQQVQLQLRSKQIKIVFDLISQTVNIVVCR